MADSQAKAYCCAHPWENQHLQEIVFPGLGLFLTQCGNPSRLRPDAAVLEKPLLVLGQQVLQEHEALGSCVPCCQRQLGTLGWEVLPGLALQRHSWLPTDGGNEADVHYLVSVAVFLVSDKSINCG